MKVKEPESLEKQLKAAEASAMEFEETSHLDDQEVLIALRKEEERKASIKLRVDMLQALKVVEVRRIFFRLLELSGPTQPSFSMESARLTDYNEGRRSVGLELLQMIDSADPQAYLRICNEHRSDEEAEKERNTNKEKNS